VKKPRAVTRRGSASKARPARVVPSSAAKPRTGAAVLKHEIHLKQLELRMQNEELRRVQALLEASCVRYAELHEFAPVGHLTLSTRGVVEEANLTCASMLAMDRSGLVGLPFARLLAPEDGDLWQVLFGAVLQDGNRQSGGLMLRRSDGSLLHAHLSCQRERPRDPTAPVRMVVVDLGDRMPGQARSREKDRGDALQAAVATLPIGVVVVEALADGAFRIVNRNPAFDAIVGPVPEDGRPLGTLPFGIYRADRTTRIPPEEGPGPRAARTGKPTQYQEAHLLRADGTWRVISASAIPMAGSEPKRALTVVMDVTGAWEAREAVDAGDSQFRALLEEAADAIFLHDQEGRFREMNRRACESLGYSREELLGMSLTDVELDFDLAASRREWANIGLGNPLTLDGHHRRKDGSVFPVQLRIAALDLQGERLHVVLARDVTTQKAADAAVVASEEKYRTLVDRLQAGVVVHGPDSSVVLANAKACQVLGLSQDQMRGKLAVDPDWRFVREDGSVMPPEEYPVSRVRATGAAVVNQLLGIDRPATRDRVWVLATAFPEWKASGDLVRIVVTFADVTAEKEAESNRRTLQARLALAARMTAMGTLVAGVAHEINNPLAALMASQGTALEDVGLFRDLLRRGENVDRELLTRRVDELAEMLVDSAAGAERIARIVKDLTAFGRPDPSRSEVRLAVAVEGAVRWLGKSMPRHISIRTETAPVAAVRGSVGQLEQVLVNLVTNAAQSIPDGRPGQVTIRVGPGEPGRVRLEIADDGPGMPPEVLDRIFDPFFTTRPVGKGTGLGLPICHAIVEAHGGTLTVESVPGQGSTFRVDLPATGAEP
jgi:PAS domain S-box-containing protein